MKLKWMALFVGSVQLNLKMLDRKNITDMYENDDFDWVTAICLILILGLMAYCTYLIIL